MGIIVKTIPIAFLVVDDAGRIQDSNQVREDIWGGAVPTTDFDEHSEHDGWWPDTGTALRPEDWPVQRALRKGEATLGMVVDIKRRDSSLATVIISTVPFKDEGGKVLGVVTTMQDYTDHRRREEMMAESKEKLELYLDILSHDVNNLNLALRGNLELYRAKVGANAPGSSYLDNAERMLDEVNDLIDNIQKLQALESGKTVQRPVDLVEVLDGAAETGRRTPGRRVTVRTEVQPGLVVEANDLVRDVFNNLVQNAIKYTPDPAEVTVRAQRTLYNGKESCRVEVEDNGMGIPDEVKVRIFNRYERDSPGTTGRGLGLYLVKSITEGFGGAVWAEDRVPGDRRKGARFVVHLPLST